MTMKIIKAVALMIVGVKLLVAIPCLLWGLLIGVIGIGPEGLVPLEVRLAGLCILFGGAGIAYPFSLLGSARRFHCLIVLDWMIATASVLPLCLFVFLTVHSKPAPPDVWPRPFEYIAVSLLCTILAFSDLILAIVLRSRGTPEVRNDCNDA